MIGHDFWGTFVEWYTDDDNGSGYGDNPRKTRWYDTLAECRRLAEGPPPQGAVWQPIVEWQPDMSPGGAAWCETYSDNRY